MHADMKGFASPPGGGHHGFYYIQMDGWMDGSSAFTENTS